MHALRWCTQSTLTSKCKSPAHPTKKLLPSIYTCCKTLAAAAGLQPAFLLVRFDGQRTSLTLFSIPTWRFVCNIGNWKNNKDHPNSPPGKHLVMYNVQGVLVSPLLACAITTKCPANSLPSVWTQASIFTPTSSCKVYPKQAWLHALNGIQLSTGNRKHRNRYQDLDSQEG